MRKVMYQREGASLRTAEEIGLQFITDVGYLLDIPYLLDFVTFANKKKYDPDEIEEYVVDAESCLHIAGYSVDWCDGYIIYGEESESR